MEPDERYYKPFIAPLLEKPGSKYTYTSLKGAHLRQYWSNYEKVLNDPKLLPQRPPLPPDDPKLRQIDHSMLVIGNLWRTDKEGLTQNRKGVNLAPLVLQHMLYGALSNDVFHRSGLVRMLWWMPESQLLEIQAPNTHRKRNLTTQFGAASDIVHLAGSKSLEDLLFEQAGSNSSYFRPPGTTQVAWINAPNQAATPAVEREHHTVQEDPSDVEAFSDINPLATTCDSFKDLDKAIQDYKDRFARLPNYIRRPGRMKHVETDEPLVYPQSLAVHQPNAIPHELAAKYNSEALRIKSARFLDMSLQLVHLEAEVAALSERYPDAPEAEKAKETVLQLGTELDHLHTVGISEQLAIRLNILLEHLLAIYASPRPLARDRRPFEPLKTDEFDFWPDPRMALIMMTPATHDFTIPGEINGKEVTQIFKQVIKQMQVLGYGSFLPAVLNNLAPNAARDLIPQVPAITDARKGGRLNPNKVRSRTLSDEMLAGLAKAYIEWPFRPSSLELLLAAEDVGDTMELLEDTASHREEAVA
ncbi:hypothetical protein AMS68_005667 [Peltaster fructicola]|uniref:Uncharacterized protein n=1 Tax=Peltaster fructicola TaxID=286661 RepID=A0A6H0Y0H8_9PEZI|nr:hypothetical protein AMS68_005667 [Peltaster fructicola]